MRKLFSNFGLLTAALLISLLFSYSSIIGQVVPKISSGLQQNQSWAGTYSYEVPGPIIYTLTIKSDNSCLYVGDGIQTDFKVSCRGRLNETKYEIYFLKTLDGGFGYEDWIDKGKPILTLFYKDKTLYTDEGQCNPEVKGGQLLFKRDKVVPISAHVNEPQKNQTNQLNQTTNDIKVRIFFKSSKENSKAETWWEDKGFPKVKKSGPCYGSDEAKLQIEGNAQNISLLINEGDNIILNEPNLTIVNKLVISHTKIIPEPGNEYTVKLLQNKNLIFTGTINPVGCD